MATQKQGLTICGLCRCDGASRIAFTQEREALSDEDLMAGILLGEAHAADVLFETYSRLILGISLRILQDYGEAEENVQETFFQVFQKVEFFDPLKGTAKSWIIQIASNRALDRRAYLQRRSFYIGTEIGSLAESLAGATDLDREVGAKLSRTEFERAFQMLTEMQRRTLELFYFEELPLREISAKLDEPLGNVRHHYYRSLERLRKTEIVQRLREKLA
ncbi:MAG TPA: sigma-70 family RNA polymerase sigma factor [Bryobacteraceae bacterium]|jgi:RNA polymerase sigma-70 factor (ECF subfamily)|nr:sigma-70 family RNA polymerase sigma factor [Bryobacteraceae bacterium]